MLGRVSVVCFCTNEYAGALDKEHAKLRSQYDRIKADILREAHEYQVYQVKYQVLVTLAHEYQNNLMYPNMKLYLDASSLCICRWLRGSRGPRIQASMEHSLAFFKSGNS